MHDLGKTIGEDPFNLPCNRESRHILLILYQIAWKVKRSDRLVGIHPNHHIHRIRLISP